MASGVRYNVAPAAWDEIPARLRRTLDQKLPEAKKVYLRNAGEAARSALDRRYRTHVGVDRTLPAEYIGEYGEGLLVTVAAGAQRSYATLSARSRNARVVERGRKPGEPPPYDEIEKWAQRKLGITSKKVIFGIRKKIEMEGTRGHHLFRDTFTGGGDARLRQTLRREGEFVQRQIKEGVFGKVRGR